MAIARALVAQPQLVLADEPTPSLDSKTRRDVVDIIQSLAKEEGCSVMLVTDDARILDIGDRIVHMWDTNYFMRKQMCLTKAGGRGQEAGGRFWNEDLYPVTKTFRLKRRGFRPDCFDKILF